MQSYDLNLLRVLDAVLAEGSVTAAAERLHLSVPATSHALARLRDVTGDPLLVRAGRRLVPTPRGQALREPVARWMAEAQTLIASAPAPSLATLQRRFVVRAPDGIPIAFGGALALALGDAMPLADLHFVAETDFDAAALRNGQVDLDFGHFRPRDPEVQVKALVRQPPVALVHQRHPLAGRKLTAQRYAAHAHVDTRLRPQAASPVDRALAALGLTRRVVVTVTHSNIAPLVAARSGLVATVSERMAQAMAAPLDMVILPLAFEIEAEPLVMAWHPRQAQDPAHRWLRDTMLRIVSGATTGHLPSDAPRRVR